MAAEKSSIEKLQKKLEKDPNSLQFLQLVEEYRKQGMLEEALKACLQGLERHPNYWSARVALGRIYHQNGDPQKAGEELEKVIQVAPDNLLANRLLGDIYSESGRPERALERYRIVQMLTPADQEVASIIEGLENADQEPQEPQEARAAETPLDVVSAEDEVEQEMEELSEEAVLPEESVPAQTEVPVVEESLKVEQAEEDLAEMANEFLLSRPPEPVVELMNDDLGLEMELSAAEADVQEGFFDSDEDVERDELPQTQDRTQPLGELSEELIEEAEELTSETLAELYAAQGLVDKAAKVYQKLLLHDPGNLQIMQKLLELNRGESKPVSRVKEESVRVPISREVKGKEIHADRPGSREPDGLNRLSEDRKRKINTLESWLHSIRRDRG